MICKKKHFVLGSFLLLPRSGVRLAVARGVAARASVARWVAARAAADREETVEARGGGGKWR